jgi:Flp pilus assembly protein CpaB
MLFRVPGILFEVRVNGKRLVGYGIDQVFGIVGGFILPGERKDLEADEVSF